MAIYVDENGIVHTAGTVNKSNEKTNQTTTSVPKKKIYDPPTAPTEGEVMLPAYWNKISKQTQTWEEKLLGDGANDTDLRLTGIQYSKNADQMWYFDGFVYTKGNPMMSDTMRPSYPTSTSEMNARRKAIQEKLEFYDDKTEKGTPLQVHEGDIESAKHIRNDAKVLYKAFEKPGTPGDPVKGTYTSPTQIDRSIHRILNIRSDYAVTDYDNSLFTYFDRYYSIFPDFELTGLCHYVYMTRPHLNLGEMKGSKGNKFTLTDQGWPTLYSMYDQQPWIVRSLTDTLTEKHDWLPIITGRVESLQLPDYEIKNYSIQQPYSGYLLPYGSHGIHSTTGGSFTLRLREVNDLSLHKMNQLWMEYISRLSLGMIKPKDEYIEQNRADYMVSVYDIICGPDARTILYWIKYTGCFPVVNPNSSLSFNKGDKADNSMDITFNFYHADPYLNPMALIDFNNNSHIDGDTVIESRRVGKMTGEIFKYTPVPSYGTGYAFHERPFISQRTGTPDDPGDYFYELNWIRRDSTAI